LDFSDVCPLLTLDGGVTVAKEKVTKKVVAKKKPTTKKKAAKKK